MGKISVNELVTGQSFDKCLTFDNQIVVLMPGLKLSKEDIDSFKSWNIDFLQLVEKETIVSSLKEDTEKEFIKKKAIYVGLTDQSITSLKKFYEEIEYRGTTSFLVIKDLAREFLFLLKQDKEFMCLYMHIYLPRTSKFESDALKVAVYSLIIGMELKLDDKKLLTLFECAVLVNIGMLKMKPLLKKAGKLTSQERLVIENHPAIGFNIIKNKMKLDDFYALITLTHHERMDRSGYPRQLSGVKIPLYSKIIAVVEEYIALSVRKPYRENFSLYDAMRQLISEGGEKLDQTMLNCLLVNLSLYPIGSVVLLNNLKVGIVFSSNRNSPLLPKVLLVMDTRRKSLRSKESLDLSSQSGVFIKKAIVEESVASLAYNCL